MNKTVIAFVSLTGAVLLSGCNQQTTSSAPDTASATNAVSAPAAANATASTSTPSTTEGTNIFTDENARESYAVGMTMSYGWKTHDVHLNVDMIYRGMQDEQSNGTPILTMDQMQAAINQLKQNLAAAHQQQMMARQQEMQEQGQKNQQEGVAFLAKNRTQPGVMMLPDGLQYKVITDGSGPSPGPNDIVVVKYTGKLVDGSVFDTSGADTRSFPVRAVIPGWTEGLEKMQVGSKWELYIPSNLAYGPMGRQPLIAPNETLIFEVELTAIQPGPTPPPPPQPLTSDIIKVPSALEMKNGAQIETIKASDVQKMQQGATN